MNGDDKLDAVYNAIVGNQKLGVKGLVKRMEKVEDFVDKAQWITWFKGVPAKIVVVGGIIIYTIFMIVNAV